MVPCDHGGNKRLHRPDQTQIVYRKCPRNESVHHLDDFGIKKPLQFNVARSGVEQGLAATDARIGHYAGGRTDLP